MQKIDLNSIAKTFFINCNDAINYKKYNKLLTYYLSAKKIVPYMIQFIPYLP